MRSPATPGSGGIEGAGRADRRGVERRDFLRGTVLVGAGITLAGARPALAQAETREGIPTRVLGRTGARVTVLGLGTAPIGEGPVDTAGAERVFGEVMDRGVNYIDTARIYGNAEEALGRLVPARRDDLFLVTKVWTDNGAKAEELLNTSLRTLRTDHVDLVHIHHIGGKNVDRALAPDGVLAHLLRARDAGKLRFIGLSGHARPPRFVRMLRTGEIDVVMCVMNYADRNTYGFEESVLPECRARGVGVAAMKVYAGIKGGFRNHRNAAVGCATPAERLPQALAYALDLEGVSTAVIGPYTLAQALQNIEFAKAYAPLAPAAREEILAFGRELGPRLGLRYGPLT
jgi:predicted aldo/keto reductase-like oxidoreductase